MIKSIKILILDLKTRIEELEKENEALKQQKAFLSTTIFDNRFTIKQLKEQLTKKAA